MDIASDGCITNEPIGSDIRDIAQLHKRGVPITEDIAKFLPVEGIIRQPVL